MGTNHVGHPGFIQAWTDKRLREERKLLEELPHLPDLQCASLLLLFCVSPRANHALRTIPLSNNVRAERRMQMQRRLGRSHPPVCTQPNALPRQHTGQPLPVILSCLPQSADRCLGALEQKNTGGLSSCRGAKRFASAKMAQLLHVAHRLRRRPPTTPYADTGPGTDRTVGGIMRRGHALFTIAIACCCRPCNRLPGFRRQNCTPTPHIKIASTSEERQRPASTTTTTTTPTKATTTSTTKGESYTKTLLEV